MTNILQQLRPHMFTHGYLDNFKDNINKSMSESKCVHKQAKKESTDVFIPKYKDTLFWCFYIMIKGWDAFYLVGRNSFSIEKECKISHIEMLRSNKELLKKNKWRRRSIEDDLLNNKILSPISFICLCALHNINVTLIKEDYYYVYVHPATATTPFYIIKNKGQYGLYNGSLPEMQQKLNKMWEIHNLNKPLRGCSAYKVGDLKKICKQINIDIYKNNRICNKQDIYKLIQSKLNKDFLY